MRFEKKEYQTKKHGIQYKKQAPGNDILVHNTRTKKYIRLGLRSGSGF